MGAYIPFVGYRFLSNSKYSSKRQNDDAQSHASIMRFVDLVCNEPAITFFLSEFGFLSNPRKMSLENCFDGIYDEKDYDNRPVLEQLIIKHVKNFTILVPDLKHITDGNMHRLKPLKMLISSNIPVICTDAALGLFDKLDFSSYLYSKYSNLHLVNDMKSIYMGTYTAISNSLRGKLSSEDYQGDKDS